MLRDIHFGITETFISYQNKTFATSKLCNYLSETLLYVCTVASAWKCGIHKKSACDQGGKQELKNSTVSYPACRASRRHLRPGVNRCLVERRGPIFYCIVYHRFNAFSSKYPTDIMNNATTIPRLFVMQKILAQFRSPNSSFYLVLSRREYNREIDRRCQRPWPCLPAMLFKCCCVQSCLHMTMQQLYGFFHRRDAY